MQQLTRVFAGGCIAVALCGCAEMHRGFETVAQATSPTAAAEPVALTSQDGEAAELGSVIEHAKALPSPKEIFDFHPAGSRPDTMRQAFLIDPNDGPLAGEVRRTAAELKTFLATIHAPTKATEFATCSTSDEKHADAGCAKPPKRMGVIAARDPLALQ